jgi:hypothetical protein
MIYRKEHLSCLHDNGQIKSIGRFVTRLDETIEFGLCHFDGCISGFRWNEDYGWEPIFIRHFDTNKGVCGMGGVSLCNYTEGNPYTEEELAFELDCFFALKHSQGL